MGSMKKLMLGAALAVGAVAFTAPAAHAAVRFGVVVGGAAYIPPCPGPGYVWVNGYWDGGVWVPGYWNFVGAPGVGVGVVVGGPAFGWAHGPYYRDRGDWDRGRYDYDHRGYDHRGADRGQGEHFRR